MLQVHENTILSLHLFCINSAIYNKLRLISIRGLLKLINMTWLFSSKQIHHLNACCLTAVIHVALGGERVKDA